MLRADRIIIANLDCEDEYAAASFRLPAAVRRMIAAAGTLMAAFARPGDALWTPEPVDPQRSALANARGVTLVSGPLGGDLVRDLRAREILPWGQTSSIATLRAQLVAQRPSGSPASGVIDLPWQLSCDAAVAKRVNDRRYAFDLGQKFGWMLPGSAILSSVEDLDSHLARDGCSFGRDNAWVLKAPFSASGRQRVRRRGTELDRAICTRVTRLLSRYGQLVFEPWVDRVRDYGCTGLIIARDRWEVLPPHELFTDGAGVFRGIAIASSWPRADQDAAQTVRDAAEIVAHQLADSGYVGPFGIDGFVYRDRCGTVQIHPMCEINARMSFGLVTHALARAYPGDRVELTLGSGPIPNQPQSGGAIVPLLQPSLDDATSAWLTIAE